MGIDLLRIVCMLMIIIGHVMNYGGGWTSMTTDMLHYPITLVLFALTNCSVDCFVLISGYVGIATQPKRSSLMKLWLQVAFYSVGVTALFCVAGRASLRDLLLSFFPVLFHQYWFFVSYFVLSLLKPLLNAGINHLEEKQVPSIFWVIIIVFTLIPTFFNSGLTSLPTNSQYYIDTKGGYGVLWFVLLYVLGGCMRRANPLKRFGAKTSLLGYVGCCIVAFASRFATEYLLRTRGASPIPSDLLFHTASPTILFSGIFLVLFASKLTRLPAWLGRAVTFLTPMCFGVYLIHEHPQIRNFFIMDRLFPSGVAHVNPVVYVGKTLTFSLAVFALCILIDWLRIKLFQALKVNQRVSAWLDN